ncbi:exocyst complex component EXO70B1-like [Prosopis cineraria]|uniref:exocyst complex component EXO70B1-like n=1 Tax=Prosopis cineraria TaxID=364024 RepID=UPI00240EA993|nr:exocyst complex component EXO70B1-like [Prosopis cineraria]
MASASIRNFLMQPKLWRLVGSVSGLVGLLCFPLSSSFELLLGHRNFHTMSLYAVISAIILGFMLWAYKWQLPRNLLFKAHVGFLVLMLTSLFSFFSNGKLDSDPLSLISCVSFAVASLSLSIQIDLGFETELFNFILGLVIFLLMTRNLLLAFIGMPICYVLVLLHSYMDSQRQSLLHSENVSINDHVALGIDVANEAGAGADNNSENCYYTIEERLQFPANIEDKLKDKVAAGFANECCHVFIGWRRQLLNDKLSRIRIQKLNLDEIDKVPLNFLEDKIKRWNTISYYVLRTLLPDERNLCKRLFSEFPYCEVFCFNELCQEPMIQLLNFADAIAAGKGSPERLFRILGMFEILNQLLPDFDSLFSDQCCVFLKDRAVKIWRRFAKEIKGVFVDLENLIFQEQEKVVPSHGGLHPLTHYIMNYLSLACKSWRTVERAFRDSENPLRSHLEIGNEESSSSPLSLQVSLIMDLLDKSLKTISEKYEDPVLRSLFMINNVRYIVQKAKRSEVGRLAGEDWIKDRVSRVGDYIVQFKESWGGNVVEMF